MKFKITNKGLYWGLIVTFGILYVLVAFVSTLHAIDFFKLSNIGSLAILLGVAYEVGQASVLFSILMTKNKEKFLPWLLMILLTGLQVTANVYASFKHMSISGSNDWTYWYTSILKIFGVQGGNTETYQVIISWISGALLPIIALGMTALVAQNINILLKEQEEPSEEPNTIAATDLISEISRVRPTEDDLTIAEAILTKKKPEGYFEKEIIIPEKEDVADNKTGALAKDEIEKIKKLMKTDPIESGMISDSLKKTLSPGLPLEDDMGDTPREQISKTLNKNIDIKVKATVEPENEVFPALSDEEVNKMFHDELEGKDLEEEEASIINQELMKDLEEEVKMLTPDPLSKEVQLERLNEIIENSEPDPELELVNENGLMGVRLKNQNPPLSDIPSDEPIMMEEAIQRAKEEEERLERLRVIARENLKKK